MNRRLTTLFASLEAGLIVVIGLAIPLVPLTVLWAIRFGFGVDWTVFWRAAVDIWLLGFGVDVTFRLDETTAGALGLAGADEPVLLTIALTGLGLVSLLLAVRAGGRIAETGHRLLGGLVAVAVTGLLVVGVTAVSLHADARPSLTQAAILPALVVAVGLVIGMLFEHGERPAPDESRTPGRVELMWRRIPLSLRQGAGAALRGGLGTAALAIALASAVLAVLFLVSYSDVIRLYQALHGEILGGVVITLAQLALLPNFLLWALSWLVGPGFALGAGSQISPLGTAIGPVPALPVFGAIPTADGPFAYLGLLVPILAALLVGAGLRRRLDRVGVALPLAGLLGVALGAAVVAALVVGVLTAASAGAAGPGRLAEVGPDALTVGLTAAVEFALGGVIGILVGATRRVSQLARWRPGATGEPAESAR